MSRQLCLALFLLFVVPAFSVRADESTTVVRGTFADYERMRTENEALRNEAWEKLRKAATDAEIKAAQENLDKVYLRANRSNAAARKAFLEALEKCDLDALDSRRDANLLETGLFELGLRDLGASPAKAVVWWEALIKRLPGCAYTSVVRPIFLPIALLSTGDNDAALKRIQELLAVARDGERHFLLSAMGDARALAGQLAEALSDYQDALKHIPPDGSNAEQDRAALELRIKWLGKAAPELDCRTWLGTEALKLSQMRGDVAVVNFWASYSTPALSLVPTLDALYRAHVHEGLRVLGITRTYEQGYVPKNMAELRTDVREGEVVQKLDEAAFTRHLWSFRERTQVSYPFALAKGEDFSAWGVTNLPTTFVVDRKGKIVFIADGGMREHLVRIAAERHLKAK